MTRTEIAILACKIVALWFIVQAVAGIASVISTLLAIYGFVDYARFSSDSVMHFSTMYAITLLGLGILIWFGSARLARRMVSNDPAPVTQHYVVPLDLLDIGCMLIGLITLVPALTQLSKNLMALVIGTYTDTGGLWSSPSWQINIFGDIVQIIFSIGLILGARNVSGFIMRSRTNR